MAKSNGNLKRNFRALVLLAVSAAVIYFVVDHIAVFGNILLVLLGFGGVVIVHELGHFTLAKISGINVEAFSILMPPTLLSIKRTENGIRFCLLPSFFRGRDEEAGEGRLSITIGKEGKAGETEYRIGLIPFGGYVKMLGQEDVGTVERSDDPRSYANKPVATRIAVISAGVIFNAISAVLVFMIVFLVGINLLPPVVGEVIPDSPAAKAGLKPGDEIIEINGDSDDLDFSNILVAAALSDKGEEVKLKARRGDRIIDFAMVAEEIRGMPMRDFGIVRAAVLTIAELSEKGAKVLFEETGLRPGDRIKAVNGENVEHHWQMQEILRNAFVPEPTLLVERTDDVSNETELVESIVRLNMRLSNAEAETETELSHICSMVPRLQITAVSSGPPSMKDRLVSLLNKVGIAKVDTGARLKGGDIILAIGDVNTPTYKEFREVTTKYENKKLPIKVLRKGSDGTEETLTVTVEPERSKEKDDERVLIGVPALAFDAEHAVVAKTIDAEKGPKALAIPRGATITAVEGVAVSNFYDVTREISRHAGKPVKIDFRSQGGVTGNVVLPAAACEQPVAMRSSFGVAVPFKDMEKLYKADGPIDAIATGYRKTVMFIAQSYLTIRRLLGGLVSPKELMGPVGIVTISYRIVTQKPLIYYCYFLGLISAFIAVFNFLPLLPFDGGHIVFLLVEKIKGSAVSERIQGTIAYAGWIMVGTLFLYVTFNDVVRSFFS
jgi:regulator of sigma E protease